VTRRKWVEIIILFFILFFAFPAKVVFGLPDWVGYLIGIPISILGIVFLLYPFVKGVKEFRCGARRLGVLLVIFGIIFPGVSGFISILVIEIAGNKAIGGDFET
jgi:hypothetical protein